MKTGLEVIISSPARYAGTDRFRGPVSLTARARADDEYFLRRECNNSLQGSAGLRGLTAGMNPTATIQMLRRLFLRSSSTVVEVMRRAIGLAGTVQQLRPEHFFISLLALDSRLVFLKLKNLVDLKELIGQVRASIARPTDSRYTWGTFSVLHFASEIAPDGPINTPHLFLGVILEPINQVSRYLRESGINVNDLIRDRFPYIHRAVKISAALERGKSDDGGEVRPSPAALESLFGLLSELAKCQQEVNLGNRLLQAATDRSVLFPMVARHTPEGKAQRWLAKLLPDQANKYMKSGFLEFKSSLFPGRFYRIHHDNIGTEIHERGAKMAVCCIHLAGSSFPPTDRVIGEYFLLRGDERKYLNTANITWV